MSVASSDMRVEHEKKMWDRLRELMGDAWLASRHEDQYAADYPDVSYAVEGGIGIAPISGWIELKVCKYPVRDSFPVRLRHFTSGQKRWLRKRDLCAGYTFVLIHEYQQDDWVLMRGQDCAPCDTLTKEQLHMMAVQVWLGAPPRRSDFITALRHYGRPSRRVL